MYAIVKVGGKQYRVEKGDSLLVDRMPADEGAKVSLEPLLVAAGGKGEAKFEKEDLDKLSVEATVTGHERGPKIHVLKFKPKRGYKRRQGHRSELTRLEIGEISAPGVKADGAKEARPAQGKAKPAAEGEAKPAATKAQPAQPKKEQGDKLEDSPKPSRPTAKAEASEPEEPAKLQGDKLEEAAKTKATATTKPGAKTKASPAEPEPDEAKPSEKEESDGS